MKWWTFAPGKARESRRPEGRHRGHQGRPGRSAALAGEAGSTAGPLLTDDGRGARSVHRVARCRPEAPNWGASRVGVAPQAQVGNSTGHDTELVPQAPGPPTRGTRRGRRRARSWQFRLLGAAFLTGGVGLRHWKPQRRGLTSTVRRCMNCNRPHYERAHILENQRHLV